MTPLFTLTDVTQRYGERQVLEIDSLHVNAGETLAIVGPSGAGKSTLLRLLALIERPFGGTLTFENRPITNDWPTIAARRRVVMMFQQPYLLNRSVRDNVQYGLMLRGKRDDALLDKLLADLQLTALADKAASALSGGEQQRVALARALAIRPDVLLLDEPTANLDPANVAAIEQMIRTAQTERQTTVVIVTHNIFQARRLAQRVGLLIDGKLIEISDTAAFFDAPQTAAAAAFLRGDFVY